MSRIVVNRRGQDAGLRPDVVHSRVERELGLDLSGRRLDLLVRWLRRRADSLAVTPDRLLSGLFAGDFSDDLVHAIALMTNQETSFFRGERQLGLVDDEVLGPLVADAALRRIRLWSAACSTGEEALTLGMMVSDKVGPMGPGVARFEIIGSDICERTLTSARERRYSLLAESQIGQERADRYFRVEGTALVANRDLFPPISYWAHNLICPNPFGQFDLILARNVFFYLGVKARAEAVDNVVRALKPGGVVVFGAHDGVRVPDRLDPIGAHCYRRRSVS